MKLTTARLKRLIKEELQLVLLRESMGEKMNQMLRDRMDNDLYAPAQINVRIDASRGSVSSNWKILEKMAFSDIINTAFSMASGDARPLMANILGTKLGQSFTALDVSEKGRYPEAAEGFNKLVEFHENKIFPKLDFYLQVQNIDLPEYPQKKIHNVRFDSSSQGEAKVNEWHEQLKSLGLYNVISSKMKG